MLNIVIPVNAEIFFSMALNLANFDILPEETLNEAVVGIFGANRDEKSEEDAEEHLNMQIINSDYETTNFIDNNFLNITYLIALSSIILSSVLLRLCI